MARPWAPCGPTVGGGCGSGDKGARGIKAAQMTELEMTKRLEGIGRVGFSTKEALQGVNKSLPSACIPPPSVLHTAQISKPDSTTMSLTIAPTCNLSTTSIPSLLASYPSLGSLYVSPYVFTGSGGLSKLLALKPSWDYLGIINNPLVLMDSLQNTNLRSIRRLDISNNKLSPESSAAFFEAIKDSRTLEALNMSGNIPHDPEGESAALGEYLKNNKFLVSLCLSDCCVGPVTVKLICESLASSDIVCPLPEHEPPMSPPDMDEGMPEAPSAENLNEDDAIEEYTEKVKQELEAAREDDENEEGEEEEGEDPEPEVEADKDEDEGSENDDKDNEVEKKPVRLTANQRREQENQAALEERVALFKTHIQEAKELTTEEMEQQHALVVEFFGSVAAVKQLEISERENVMKRQLEREQQEAQRMSGWSHLESLDLSCNPIKSEGAALVALMLRKTVPKTEDEIAQEEVCLSPGHFSRRSEPHALPRNRQQRKKLRQQQQPKQSQRYGVLRRTKYVQVTKDEASKKAENDESTEQNKAEEEESSGANKEVEPEEPSEPEVTKTKAGLRSIAYLDLSECNIGSKGLKSLSAVLQSENDTLKTLLLQKNKFGVKKIILPPPEGSEEEGKRTEVSGWRSPGVAALAACLVENNTLQELSLGNNVMGPVNAECLFSSLQQNKSLTSLNMESNRLAGAGADVPVNDEDCNNITKCMHALNSFIEEKCNDHITALNLKDNMLASRIECLKSGFTKACGLQKLDLSYNELGGEGLGLLAECVPNMTSLVHLNVAGNAAQSMESFLQSLQTSNIVVLDISENQLSTCAEFSSLTELACKGSLKELVMRNVDCRETSDRLELLLSSSLEVLDISNNMLEYDVIRKIITYVPMCKLRVLHMWTAAPLDPSEWADIMGMLLQALPEAPNLRLIDINPSGDSAVEKYQSVANVLKSRL